MQICIFRFYIHTYFPESRSGKYFQASGMRAIDFPHKINLIWVIFRILKNFQKITMEDHYDFSKILDKNKNFHVLDYEEGAPCANAATALFMSMSCIK